MTPREPFADDLREALRDGDTTAAGRAEEELIRQAVAGELDTDQLAELVDRIHREPALASAWSAAVVLRDELTVRGSTARKTAVWRSGRPVLIGLAAALVLAVTAPFLVSRRPAEPPVQRDAAAVQITTSIPDGSALPRDSFDLAWSLDAEHGVYRVRVLDSDLRVLYQADDLAVPRLLVPEEALAELPSGADVLWWVETTDPSGRRLRSPTFVQSVR